MGDFRKLLKADLPSSLTLLYPLLLLGAFWLPLGASWEHLGSLLGRLHLGTFCELKRQLESLGKHLEARVDDHVLKWVSHLTPF